MGAGGRGVDDDGRIGAVGTRPVVGGVDAGKAGVQFGQAFAEEAVRDVQVQGLAGRVAQGGGQFQEGAAAVADVVDDQHGLGGDVIGHAGLGDAAGLRVADFFGVAHVGHAQLLGQGLHALAGAGVGGHQGDAVGKGGGGQGILEKGAGVDHAHALQQGGGDVAVGLDDGDGGVLLVVDQFAEHRGAKRFARVADAVLPGVGHIGHVQVHGHGGVQAAQRVGQHQQLHDVVGGLEQGVDAEFVGGVGLGLQAGGHGDLAFAAGEHERGRGGAVALSFYYRCDGEHDQALVAN